MKATLQDSKLLVKELGFLWRVRQRKMNKWN